MSQEMKLLLALTEALGFEVETTLDYQERKEPKHIAIPTYNSGRTDLDRELVAEGPHNMLLIDEDGMYTSMLKSPIVDYKVRAKQ